MRFLTMMGTSGGVQFSAAAAANDLGQGRIALHNTLIVSIIDDDESVRTATSSLVRSLGWEARLYASAEAFLASGVIDQTACVISDVQMPGMTGLDLQRALTEQGHTLPFIFITAFRSDAAFKQAMAHGALCFLSKPVDGAVVAQCLDALRQARAAPPQ